MVLLTVLESNFLTYLSFSLPESLLFLADLSNAALLPPLLMRLAICILNSLLSVQMKLNDKVRKLFYIFEICFIYVYIRHL